MDDEEQQCPCCQIFYGPTKTPPDFAPYVTVSRSPLHPTLGVCKDCMHHLGDGFAVKKARARHHFQMLRREYGRMRKKVTAARQAVEEMQRELNMRPVQTVVRVENLDQIVVSEALADRDEAYRRRDLAMGALSDVRVLHHKNPDSNDKCVCGKQYRKCQMAVIADRWEGITIWERSEAGKAYRGERHHLLHDHPALKDRQYFGRVYGA